MNYMDAEELAMNVLGLSDEQADGADFDDLMYDKFEISMEQFHKVAEALSAFTVPMQAGWREAVSRVCERRLLHHQGRSAF